MQWLAQGKQVLLGSQCFLTKYCAEPTPICKQRINNLSPGGDEEQCLCHMSTAETFLVTWCDSSQYTFPLHPAATGFICHRSKINGMWILLVASLQFYKPRNPRGNQRYSSCNFLAVSKDQDIPHWPQQTSGRRIFGDRSCTGKKMIFRVQTQPKFGEGGCRFVFFSDLDVNMPHVNIATEFLYRLFQTMTDMLRFH